MDEKPLEQAQTGVALIGEVLRLAGDNPDTRAAGNQLGKTALTVTTAINNVLLPVAAVNFAFAKARKYFDTKFSADLSEKAERIPPDQIVEPKASIAGPALQGLAFSHDEPELKELYLSLLTSSMDARTTSLAHPAFAEVIRQLTADEARLLRPVLAAQSLAAVELRLALPDNKGWLTLLSNLINTIDKSTHEPHEIARLPAMIDNWVRLGLVAVSFDRFLKGDNPDPYAWVEKRPEIARFRAEREVEGRKVEFARGIVGRTSFGKEFARAVGIIDSPSEVDASPPTQPSPAA
jgi:hypothetical protein